MLSVPPASAIDDPALLGPYFQGDSWSLWRTILRAAEGLPLSDEQAAAFHEVAERDPPSHRVRELWVVAGRRAGKDSVASAIAATAAIGDYRHLLRPGEPAVVMCLACDREQARICHGYIVAYFKSVPLLQPLVRRETDNGLELVNGVEVIIATNSFRSVRGRTIVCCIFDEVAFWRSEDTASPDFEVYTAIEPGMATLPGAMLVGISTPYRRGGLVYRKFTEAYGKPDPNVLVVRGPSRLFNPLLPQRIVDAALERDPEAASAEWLAQWRDDLSDYVDRQIIESCVMSGVFEVPPEPAATYSGFFDPAAGTGSDSAALAIGHADADGTIVIDALREWRPPFSPETVVSEAAPLLHSYGTTRIVGDRWAGLWSVEPFAKRGVIYEQSAAPKSDQYRDCLPLLNSRRVRMPDNRRLVNQFCSLERQVTRTGKDSIAEPRGAHDDLCNAVAGVAGLIAAAVAPALWRAPDLRIGGASIPWPVRCLAILITAAADARGCFVAFWAIHSDRYPLARKGPFGPRTLLIDFDQAPLSPPLFGAIANHAVELAAKSLECPITHRTMPATTGVIAIVTRELLPHAIAAGLDVRVDGTTLLEAARPALLLAAAIEIGAGEVKLSDCAEATACRLPLPLSAIRPDEIQPTAAIDACLLGIGASLPADRQPREWRAGLSLSA
jgi:hypothetical protein